MAVGLDTIPSVEVDLQVSNNWNKNKRRKFKPVTPMRDKKRRLFYSLTQTIINSLRPKINK